MVLDIPEIDGVDLLSDSFLKLRIGQLLDASTDPWRLDYTGFLVFEGDVCDEFDTLADVTRHYRGQDLEDQRCQRFARKLDSVNFGFRHQNTIPDGVDFLFEDVRVAPPMHRVPDIDMTVTTRQNTKNEIVADVTANGFAVYAEGTGGANINRFEADFLLLAEV